MIKEPADYACCVSSGSYVSWKDVALNRSFVAQNKSNRNQNRLIALLNGLKISEISWWTHGGY